VSLAASILAGAGAFSPRQRSVLMAGVTQADLFMPNGLPVLLRDCDAGAGGQGAGGWAGGSGSSFRNSPSAAAASPALPRSSVTGCGYRAEAAAVNLPRQVPEWSEKYYATGLAAKRVS
jgi:hypothetical protein